METATLAGLPSDDAMAPDVTGPDITPTDLPPRARVLSHRPAPVMGLVVAALAGIGLASLIGAGGHFLRRRFSGPVLSGRQRTL